MRRPAGRLIGLIRLHRRRGLRARGRGAADPDSGSAADARAQRIEVFSEDSRLLRTLLLAIALLSFVYAFQADERLAAVQTLNDAHGNIALEAVLGGKLTSPSRFQSLGVGDAMSEIDLLPRAPGPPELIVDAAAQAMLELERRGHRISRQLGTVTLFSPTLNATVEASLDRVERPRALQAAVAHAQDALVRARSGGSRPGDRSPPLEYLTQVAQRCPSKWLQAGAQYRVAGDGAPVSREVAALSMGSATLSSDTKSQCGGQFTVSPDSNVAAFRISAGERARYARALDQRDRGARGFCSLLLPHGRARGGRRDARL